MLAVAGMLTFPKTVRLLTAAHFKRVFDHTEWRASSKTLLILASANQSQCPRIGFVLAKKNVKRAVDRNRIKRLIRESFRHHQHQLSHADFVILARPGLAELDNQEIRAMIDALWFKLKRADDSNTRRRSRRR